MSEYTPEKVAELVVTAKWLPVVGYEGFYEVSDHGQIRSVDRDIQWNGTTRSLKGKPLRGFLKKGHREVRLSLDGSTRAFMVHRLVLEAFVGPRPPGMECCHWNGDAEDNRVENLRWDTRSGNMRDRVRHGRHNLANRTHCPQGHPLSGDNLRFGHRGERVCHICRKAKSQRWKEKRRRILRAALDQEPHASNVSEHPETDISAGQMSVNTPTVDSQFYEGLAAARRAPCIRAVPGSVIPCCGVSSDGEATNHEGTP